MKPFVPDPPERELGDDLFSRRFKNWREWKNAVDFLTNLHIGVDDAQVLCCAVDPPDVVYKEAAFEIKEIMDEGRRRHDEAKRARARATLPKSKNASKLRPAIDLLPEVAGMLIVVQLEALAHRYTTHVKAQTDLLFYINKLDHWFDDGPMPASKLFVPYGWRSVSALISSGVSIVFQANASAPQFLQSNVGVVRHRHEKL